MVTEFDVTLADGRTLHCYDTGPPDGLPVFWHHGTPNVGAPPAPLFAPAAELGLRWVAHDRPAYGGSTPRPGRSVGAVAADVAELADALQIKNFAVMGHSGGGPHALACAALLPQRVLGVVCGSGLAPMGAEGLDWFAGFSAGGAGELRAATEGRHALEHYLATHEFDPESFIPADNAALEGEWSWLLEVVGKAMEGGPAGMLDDDVAVVGQWEFEPAEVRAPVLLLHGGRDRMVPSSHSEWLARHISHSELWLRPDDGHISVLSSAPAALRWLAEMTSAGRDPVRGPR